MPANRGLWAYNVKATLHLANALREGALTNVLQRRLDVLRTMIDVNDRWDGELTEEEVMQHADVLSMVQNQADGWRPTGPARSRVKKEIQRLTSTTERAAAVAAAAQMVACAAHPNNEFEAAVAGFVTLAGTVGQEQAKAEAVHAERAKRSAEAEERAKCCVCSATTILTRCPSNEHALCRICHDKCLRHDHISCPLCRAEMIDDPNRQIAPLPQVDEAAVHARAEREFDEAARCAGLEEAIGQQSGPRPSGARGKSSGEPGPSRARGQSSSEPGPSSARGQSSSEPGPSSQSLPVPEWAETPWTCRCTCDNLGMFLQCDACGENRPVKEWDQLQGKRRRRAR